MIYFCGEERRRSLVRSLKSSGGAEPLNGIDYLEVVDSELKGTPQEALRQRILRVFFVREPQAALRVRLEKKPPTIGVEITGGERVTSITVDSVRWVSNAAGNLSSYLEVNVTPRGDFSTYTLRLVERDSSGGSQETLKELDPQLASIDFSFKVECPSDFDCRSARTCPPEVKPTPECDYLAKDYASFRQLLLDRVAVLLPDWRERSPADLGMTLVEMLAYVGDHLSYRQDAVATEAYLGTARQRVSVRRHAKLLDYHMHEGCNARVWVQVQLKQGETAPADGVLLKCFRLDDGQSVPHTAAAEPVPSKDLKSIRTRFTTAVPSKVVIDDAEFSSLVAAYQPEVFEPMADAVLYYAHNEMPFYTWGEGGCCLPKGATKAALEGYYPHLRPGDVLIFKEKLGPRTGCSADADLTHRCAVRLTKVNGMDRDQYAKVTQTCDKIPERRDTVTPDGDPKPFTEIEWAAGDALPFPFCLSTADHPNVSVALGNIVLADHGMTVLQSEALPQVPQANPVLAQLTTGDCGDADDQERNLTPPGFVPGSNRRRSPTPPRSPARRR